MRLSRAAESAEVGRDTPGGWAKPKVTALPSSTRPRPTADGRAGTARYRRT